MIPPMVGALVLAAAACNGESWTGGPSVAKPEAAASAVVNFRLKWFIYSSFAHHLVAAEEGFYAKEGLDVKIHPGGAGLDPIKLVATGQDDVGLAAYAQILFARQQGIPLIAIGEEYVKNGAVAITLESSGISRPQDFVGHTVGVIPGSDTGTVYAALMGRLGIDRAQVKEITVGLDLAPFFQKRVDVTTAAFLTNQVIIAKRKGFPVKVIDPAEYGVDPGGNVFFITEASLRDNPTKRAIIKRFMRASVKAIVQSQSLPAARVVDYVLKYNPHLDRETELDIWDATKAHLLEKDATKVGYMDPRKWKHTAELFHQYGGLKSAAEGGAFTNALIEEVHAELDGKR